ncbi:ssDNA endodeoxyribonuclease [Tulasnella sp. 331]|nr:ssDNA endodeoxyribonuclease [Tulasnella sp. 331]
MSASQGASQQGSQQRKPVLEATAPDVRPIANVIRGVNFGSSQRASVNILEAGFSIVAEEARTLVARAILPYTLFETYNFSPPASKRSDEDILQGVSFEVELNALLTVLDIFGGAGSMSSGVPSIGRGGKGKWASRDNDDAEHIEINGTGGGIERYFQGGERAGKATGMRMTYIGSGHPLALTLSEDANGPVTTCNLSTMEPEPYMDLPFDDDNT